MNDADLSSFVCRTFASAGVALITADAAAVARHALPQLSSTFLRDVGLPAGRPFGFDFGIVRRLPTIQYLVKETDDAASLDPQHGGFPCVAEQYGAVLALDPRFHFAVRRIDLTGKHEPLFVNSTVELLGASLAAYVALRLDPKPPLSAAERQRRLTEQVRNFDPAALDNEEGWWRVVIEEMGYGLS